MMRKTTVVGAAIALSLLPACGNSSGCEDAKKTMEPLIRNVCSEPAYANSPFCLCCVANGFYSVDNDCQCRALNFDTEVCQYALIDQAMPKVRAAVEFADSICSVRNPMLPYLQEAGPVCRAPAVPTLLDASQIDTVEAGSIP